MTGMRAYLRRAPPTPSLQGAPPTPPLQEAPKRPLREEIPNKHELDWLATKSPENLCEDKPKDNRDAHAWHMMTVESFSEFQIPKDSRLSSRQKEIDSSEILNMPELERLELERVRAGQTLLRRRGRLAALCGWTGPARKYAISVATAIDEVMNILSRVNRAGSNTKLFEWPLDVLVDGDTQRIWFTINNDGKKWKSNFTEIEAALSLGLFGVEHKTPPDEKLRIRNKAAALSPSDDWLRLDEENVATKRRKSIRLLGPNTAASRRDLLWWCGPRTGRVKEVWLLKDGVKVMIVKVAGIWGSVSKVKDDKLIKEYHLAGFEDSMAEDWASEDSMAEDWVSEHSVSNDSVSEDKDVLEIEQHRIAGFGDAWKEFKLDQQGGDSSTHQSCCLAAVSEGDLELLYAQHMFSAFMWTIAKDVKNFTNSIIDETQQFDPTKKKSWQSLKLGNNTVMELAQCVQRAGLGDIEDAYLSIIPPLSKEDKLLPVGVFHRAREIALRELSQRHWKNAYDVYRLLLQNFITSGVPNGMAVEATALFTEFFMLLSRTTKLQKGQVVEGNKDEVSELEKLKVRVLKHLEKADEDVMRHLAELYEEQGWIEDRKELQLKNREPCSHKGDDVGGESGFEKSDCSKNSYTRQKFHEVLKLKPLHRAVIDGNWNTVTELLQEEGQPSPTLDFFGRTALHYVACKGWGKSKETIVKKRSIWLLLDLHGSKDATDSYGMTALLTAAEIGNLEIVKLLVKYGAKLNERNFQDKTALHIAAERGDEDVVKELVDAGANTTGTTGGRTALHLAVLGCHSV